MNENDLAERIARQEAERKEIKMKLPKQYEQIQKNILAKTRKLDEIDLLQITKKKELEKVNKAIRRFSRHQKDSAEIIKIIQTDNIKQQLSNGSIFKDKYEN